jgi:hypothetical protein
MQTLSSEILKVEPNSWICTTERITSELSRCSGNNKDCKYSLYAGNTCTYCLHPDHKEFLMLYN